MTAETLNVDVIRQKAGLGLGQYIRVKDDPIAPGMVVVEYLLPGQATVEARFDTEAEAWVSKVITWLREVSG